MKKHIINVTNIKCGGCERGITDALEKLGLKNIKVSHENQTVEFDDRDIERFRVEDDADEITIEDPDFEDGDATVIVNAKYEQDDVKYKASYEVDIRDGVVEDVSVISSSIEER